MKTKLHLLFILFLLTSVKLFAQDDLAMAFPKEVLRISSSSTGLPVFEFKVYSNVDDLSTISKDMIEEMSLASWFPKSYFCSIQNIPIEFRSYQVTHKREQSFVSL